MPAIATAVRDGIAQVTIDHPPLNILTRAVLGELRAHLDDLTQDPTIRVLVLRANGKHFSAGADVGEHLPPVVDEMIPEFIETIRQLDGFPVPTIGAVQGKCLGGGCELALAVDVLVAADNATFGQPEIVLGVVPPAACAMLPTRTARGVAAELLYTGDPLSAADARDAGLVRHIVPPEQLDDATAQLARRISRHSAAALRIAKRSLRAATQRAHDAALADAQAAYLDELMRTEDALEGLTAFVDKRQPTWRHR